MHVDREVFSDTADFGALRTAVIHPPRVPETRLRILRHIKHLGQATVNGLANHFGLTTETIVKALGPLIEFGYVDRRQEISKAGQIMDGVFSLTEKGEAALVREFSKPGLVPPAAYERLQLPAITSLRPGAEDHRRHSSFGQCT